jgi:3-oxoadipate enol-lactonase
VQVVSANGVYLHTRTDGPTTVTGRPPVVFVNSLGTDLRLWDGVVAALPAEIRALRYDKRGHGLSDAPQPPYTLEDHAGDLLALLDAWAIDRAVICGISVGGMIALKAAIDAPGRVQGVVAMDTGHRIGSRAHWQQRIDAVARDGLAPLADGIVAGWLSDAYRASDPGATAAWRNMVARTPSVAGYVGTCATLRDADLGDADLGDAGGAVQVPVLCLCGADDASTPPALMRELAGLLANARYREIAGTKHLPCIEEPELVARRIAELMEECAGGG